MSFRSSRKAIRFFQGLEDAREQHRAAEDQKRAEERRRAKSEIRVAESDLRAAKYDHTVGLIGLRAAGIRAYYGGITDTDEHQQNRDKVRQYEILQWLLAARTCLEEQYEPPKDRLFHARAKPFNATAKQDIEKKIREREEELSRIEERGRARAAAGGSRYAEKSRHAADYDADSNYSFGGSGTYQHQREKDYESERHIAREAEETAALNVVQAHKHDEASMKSDGPVTHLNHRNLRNGECDNEIYVVSGREADVSSWRRLKNRLKPGNRSDALLRHGQYFTSRNEPTLGLETHNGETFRAAQANAVQAYLDEHGHSWSARMRTRHNPLGGLLDPSGAVTMSPITTDWISFGNKSWYHDKYTKPRLRKWKPFKVITQPGKNLRIVIDNPGGVMRPFVPGETISGRVVFSTANNCILTNASISLWGQTMASYTVTTSHVNATGGGSSTHTYLEHIDLFKTRACKLVSQSTTVEDVYEWPFHFILPQTTEYLRTNGKHDRAAGWFVTGPHRLPPSIQEGNAWKGKRQGVMYGLDAEIKIDKSIGKHLHQRLPIVVSSWLDGNSTSPVLTTRCPLGQWQRWNGPFHQRVFMHFGSSSGSIQPVVDFGAFVDLRLPRTMTEPMSMALFVRQNESLDTINDSPPRLILVEVHLKLKEYWRKRVQSHTEYSNRRILGTFHTDNYSHVLPADGTPLMLMKNMTFCSFATQSDTAILPTFKSYLRSHIFGLVVEAKIRHQLSGHIFKVASEVEWDITAMAGSGSASGTAPVPNPSTTVSAAAPPSVGRAEVVQLTSSSGSASTETTAATATSRAATTSGAAATSGAIATSPAVFNQVLSNGSAAASTTSISSVSGTSDSGSSAGGASDGMTSPLLPVAKLSKGSGAANASNHTLSAASSTASIHSGVIGGGRSRSSSMARTDSASRSGSASRTAREDSQTRSASGTATSAGGVEKSLGGTLRRSKRSASPVTAARTVERIFKHNIDDGVSDHKTAAKASKESVVSSKPAGSTTEVTTEVVSA